MESESSFLLNVTQYCGLHKWVTKLLPSSSNVKSNGKITLEEIILIEHITGLIYNSSVIAYENLKGMSNS